MSIHVKRLRVFAGPNGSGKSTLYDYLVKTEAFHSYYYINPDIILKDLNTSFDLNNFPIIYSDDELINFLNASSFQSKVDYKFSEVISLNENKVSLKYQSLKDISYLAAVIADFIRTKMIISNSSFSFESVFSHESKIKILEDAKNADFKIYLYFIATSNPEINIQRVKNRVESGGHDVAEDKVNSRYYKTMNNLYSAFELSDKAFFFDNSNLKMNGSFDFFAEKNGKKVYLSDPLSVPHWFFDYILKKI